MTGWRQALSAFCLRIGVSCLSASLVLLIGAPVFVFIMNDAPFWDALYEMSGVGGALWAVAAACFAGFYLLGRSQQN